MDKSSYIKHVEILKFNRMLKFLLIQIKQNIEMIKVYINMKRNFPQFYLQSHFMVTPIKYENYEKHTSAGCQRI